MLHIMKDDFDENADDILNSINKMLSKSKDEEDKEEIKNEQQEEK